jgi:hypothetical protein
MQRILVSSCDVFAFDNFFRYSNPTALSIFPFHDKQATIKHRAEHQHGALACISLADGKPLDSRALFKHWKMPSLEIESRDKKELSKHDFNATMRAVFREEMQEREGNRNAINVQPSADTFGE